MSSALQSDSSGSASRLSLLIIKTNVDQPTAKTAAEMANETIYREAEPDPFHHLINMVEEHNESGQL